VVDTVSEVLVQKTKKNRFLVNVGMKSVSASEDNAKSQCELEAELVVEKQTSSDLRELVKTQQLQMDEMMKKFHESETTRARQEEKLKKKHAETDALIKGLMSMIPGSLPTGKVVLGLPAAAPRLVVCLLRIDAFWQVVLLGDLTLNVCGLVCELMQCRPVNDALHGL
jgi:hypothetical protein